jgi:hypothetical protein
MLSKNRHPNSDIRASMQFWSHSGGLDRRPMLLEHNKLAGAPTLVLRR